MTTFHKKLVLGFTILFVLIGLSIIPFGQLLHKKIIHSTWGARADTLIAQLQKLPNEESAVAYLKNKEPTTFYRLALISPDKGLLYDTHIPTIDAQLSNKHILHPEVMQALSQGEGFNEAYSQLFGEELAYYAKEFDLSQADGKKEKYVLRMAFSLEEMDRLEEVFIFWNCGGMVLLLFIALLGTGLLTYRFTRFIKKITAAIRPYYLGNQEELPYLSVSDFLGEVEIEQLAVTINQLSSKIRQQIEIMLQQRNEKDTLLESLIEGVIATNSDDEIEYCNHAALNMIGKLKHEIQGKSFQLLGENECHRLVHQAYQKQSIQSEMLYLQGMGYSSRFFNMTAIPLPDRRGGVLLLNDQTEHYKILQVHKEFIANASHELKTPVTIIQGFAETLQQIVDLEPQKVQQIVDKILRHTHRLNQLISSLLSLSQIENRSLMQREECNLVAIARRSQELLQTTYSTAQIIIENPSVNINIYGEPKLLETALVNLMENGIKYSPEPAYVKVSFGVDEREKMTWVKIEDHGIGIADKDISHVFERFYRVEQSRSRSHGGAGLGLSIVQTVISKHGGTIEVASTPGQGTTFTLKFY